MELERVFCSWNETAQTTLEILKKWLKRHRWGFFLNYFDGR